MERENNGNVVISMFLCLGFSCFYRRENAYSFYASGVDLRFNRHCYGGSAESAVKCNKCSRNELFDCLSDRPAPLEHTLAVRCSTL